MKYGLLVASTKNSPRTQKFVNAGDNMQTLAIEAIYERMNIPAEEIVLIDFSELQTYEGEYVLLPINFLFQTDYHNIPFSNKIVPCFVGLSLFATEYPTPPVLEYLRRYEPIGCRDEQTLNLLREHAIDAYLAGCMSATLPLRENLSTFGQTASKRVLLVDLSDEIKRALPKFITDGAEEITHILTGERLEDTKFAFEETRRLLQKYRDEAGLVITSRLHCLSPCMATGIPTVGLFADITPRMAWLDKLIPLHTIDDIDKIDWNVRALEYESVKERMIDVCISRIRETYSKYNDLLSLSAFFEDRERTESDQFLRSRARALNRQADERFDYVIWGCGQIGLRTVKVMREFYPNARLIGAIDTYSKAKKFSGLPVERPECLREKYMSTLCLITMYSGEGFAKDFMARIGKKNYCSFASVNG